MNKIEFVSRGQAKNILNHHFLNDVDPEFVMISISDNPTEKEDMVRLGENLTPDMDALYLDFSDVDEPEENGLMTDEQAEEIVEFIRLNSERPLLVHCFAGISRSGAVAKFANFYLGNNDSYLERYVGHNGHVYEKLMGVIGMSMTEFYRKKCALEGDL